MDERCKVAHAKLLAGTCPWCGRFIVAGRAEGQPETTFASASMKQRLGQNLQQSVDDQGVFSFKETVSIVEQIAREVARIHIDIRLHGGLSPAHVMILDEGVGVLENEILRDDEGSIPTNLNKGRALGAADYLAPEQALNSQRADGRADIYSIGCILYFMLTGRVPFPGLSVSERLLKHQVEEPETIRVFRHDVPLSLVAICRRMMEKQPEKRYQSAHELLVAISRWKEEN